MKRNKTDMKFRIRIDLADELRSRSKNEERSMTLRLAGDWRSIPNIAHRRMIRHVRDLMGLKEWPKDCLRKTCATYSMAQKQDSAKVADELGNSPSILLRHYRGLASKADAEKFFSLFPEQIQAS